MNIHEDQAKEIFEKYGIAIPRFVAIESVDQVEQAMDTLGVDQAVVKVLIHAGGRGKAGGVKIGKTREEVKQLASEMLGMKIVNNQTGPEGVVAHRLMIAEVSDIAKEYYVGAVIDRQQARASLMISPEGGVDIEEVAEKNPEAIMTVALGVGGSLKGFQLRKIAQFMGWEGETAKQGAKTLQALGKAFRDIDASMVEINPLITTTKGDIIALDGKIGLDENALFRHPQLAALYDPTQVPEREARAKEHDLAYVALDGNIGCMVNGAGLAMATMDIIAHYGGTPSNFLDVGGGASKEKVAEGFKIILSDQQVRAILVNIFGGIMDCGVLAAGIVSAANELKLTVPLVVRMEGTNVEKGREILQESGLNIITADSMASAAEKAVAAAGI